MFSIDNASSDFHYAKYCTFIVSSWVTFKKRWELDEDHIEVYYSYTIFKCSVSNIHVLTYCSTVWEGPNIRKAKTRLVNNVQNTCNIMSVFDTIS